MPKKIRLSADAGTTWYTLPGNSGELSDETGEIEDTVFGQAFKSSDSGLINWKITSNAFYKGFAGYKAVIKKPGVSTTFTTEAFTLVTGKTYQINDVTKRVWDRTGTFNVFDNGVNQNANILSLDYLHGRVTFKTTYTVTGPVTVTGKYFPMTQVAAYRGFTLGMSTDAIDNTDIPTAQTNGGYMTFDPGGLKTVSLELNGVYSTTNAFRAALIARNELILEINPDGGGASIARGFFKYGSRGQKGDVGALEEETLTARLFVPDDALMETPFSWFFGSGTTINLGVRKAIEAWQGGTTLKCQYLPDGVAGFQGDVVLTDVSLTGGLEAMNEFSIQMQCTGDATII